MKHRMTLLLALAGLAASACSVGQGVGAASGVLFEYGCSKDGDYCTAADGCGTYAAPVPYDMHPSYFSAEPINDLRAREPGSAIMDNRLIIRLQRSGKQIDLNDVLTFDIVNSYEVARCVRGRIDPVTGQNDWDPNNCYRSPGKDVGRLRVQYDSDVNASLALKATCTSNLVANAVSADVPLSYATVVRSEVKDGSWDSWVEFQEFGTASQADRPPSSRDPVSPKFLVDFGQRLYATTFRLRLVDSNVVNAAIKALPQPHSQIGGVLGGEPTTGRFDFDLQRGRGAQFFP